MHLYRYRISTAWHRYALHCRLFDYVPPEHTGTPQYYIIHAWSGSFEEMVAALLEQLTELDEDGDIVIRSRASVLIWVDLFSLDHGAPRMDVSDALLRIEDIQASCSSGEDFSGAGLGLD